MALFAGCIVPLAFAAAPKADLTGSWQLFIDDHLIGAKENVVRTYHPFVKHPGNPVLKADQPWEHNVVNCDAVLPTEDGSGYRMWYYCWSTRNDPDRSHALYATSADGIQWTKPKLGLLPWKVTGSSDNNLVGAGDSLMFTPFDPDPARRYKAVRYEGESGAKYFLYSSPDGLRWQRLSPSAIFDAGDTSHVMWDPFTNRYRGYAKVNVGVNGLRRRGIGFSEETRFESWPALRLVMAPDDFDDRWAPPGSIQRTHFYRCSVFPYQNMYIGLLSIYRAEDDEGYFHGPIFIELVTSRDGVHWRRQDGDRPPILETGPKRSWDHGMLDVGSSLLRVGDELRVYYSGYDGLHDYLPFHSAVGMGTLRADGFASLDGDDNPGSVVTKPLLGLTGILRLNCEAAKGLVQVEVLDANDRVLPGYRRREFNEPRGDGIDQVVSWQEHDELPAQAGPLKLRFWLKNASLYSFHAGDAVRVAEQPAPAKLAALFTFEKANGKVVPNAIASAPRHELRFLGTSKIDREEKNAGRGRQSVAVASPWRPLNTLQISGTAELGRTFTLALMARSTERKHARLFSAYNGNRPVNGSELVFDYDPSGRVLSGLRLIAHGIPLLSDPITVQSEKYHHLAVTYDEGHVRFYFDGEPVGEGWLPGGAPIRLARDLLVGEDADLGSDEQFNGNLDDIVVLGRALAPAEIKAVAAQGAEAFFATEAAAAPTPKK
ncbi:MAG: LamG domain-containing protein [Opitutaceae bacterium]|nr:LamG domain-containing protein [Opitutaceae bacterium]